MWFPGSCIHKGVIRAILRGLNRNRPDAPNQIPDRASLSESLTAILLKNRSFASQKVRVARFHKNRSGRFRENGRQRKTPSSSRRGARIDRPGHWTEFAHSVWLYPIRLGRPLSSGHREQPAGFRFPGPHQP